MTPGLDVAAVLLAWDGRDSLPLRDLADGLAVTPESVGQLVTLARRSEPALPVGATWVLKRWLERGHAFDRRLSGRLAVLLDRELPWAAALHVLQSLPRLDLTPDRWRDLEPALEAHRRSPRAIVRAWAYNGLALLADREPGLRRRVRALLDAALADEAPSVQARIRNVRTAW
jgi:hypothetical protein